MKGDFSRDTFDPARGFLRVLMQQGRVQLDADMNEQVAILLHTIRRLAVDLKGWRWGEGFQIEPIDGAAYDFSIAAGSYYVDGLLCETEVTRYTKQPHYPLPSERGLKQLLGPTGAGMMLVYLDVWERHITFIEDKRLDAGNIPSIREVALNGPDTCTRTRLVWQVRALPIPEPVAEKGEAGKARKAEKGTIAAKLAELNADQFRELLAELGGEPLPGDGALRARVSTGGPPDTGKPCVVAPAAGYRGMENQLYRVEIHLAGSEDEPYDAGRIPPAGGYRPPRRAKGKAAPASHATFKWSRENGSVAFPVRAIAGPVITLDHLWRDERLGLRQGDWVELENDETVLQGRPGQLFQVQAIDPTRSQITLEMGEAGTVGISDDPGVHPLLRRWDQRAELLPPERRPLAGGAVEVLLAAGDFDGWITLEQGVQVQFQPGRYRHGDSWLIPARYATGDVEWPKDDDGNPAACPPHRGGHHAYAPLAIISVAADGAVKVEEELRNKV